MQEKQLLSRLNVAEQRIVDLYHKLKSTDGGGSITVNGWSPVNDLTIQGTSTQVFYNSGELVLSVIYPPLPYKVYRAKIAMQSIDWPGYGYLYNWFAVDSVLGLANPAGGTGLTAPNEWRVPSDTDWNTLATFAGGTSVASGKLKSTLTSTGYPYYGWVNNNGATDDYNFGALGGGLRQNSGFFESVGSIGIWWTSTVQSSGVSWTYIMDATNTLIVKDNKIQQNGFSVRLVREATAGELLLNDGDTSDTSSLDPYTGNNGETYVTVKIDTQIWLAQNLRETQYNDNSDITNCSYLGGDLDNGTWESKGAIQEGAWTAYTYYAGGTSYSVEYDPTIIKVFYNDVLENTIGVPLIWTENSGLITYSIIKGNLASWGKTHIKLTHAYVYDSSIGDYIEKNLIITEATEGSTSLTFKPFSRSNSGTFTFEDLNNYSSEGGIIHYVYIEILEYVQNYYSQNVGIGVSNL